MATSGTEQQTVDTELPAAAALADGTANPTAPAVGAFLLGWQGASWNRVGMAIGSGDGGSGGSLLATAGWVWNGTNWERPRTPNKFNLQGPSGAGNSAVWTPAAGKKFRLMRAMLIVPNNCAMAVAGINQVTFQDGATPTNIGWAFFLPGAAAATPGATAFPWIDLGNGLLSAAANNVLNINLATTLTVGFLWVVVAGTEE